LPVLLSLDLAGRVGWACGAPGGSPSFGVLSLPQDAGLGRLLDDYDRWLTRTILDRSVTTILFESPILRAKRTHPLTARRLMSLAGLTELAAHLLKLDIWEASTLPVTKFFCGAARFKTGRGPAADREAKKAAVIAECHRRGWNAQDDDMADALALFAYAEAKIFSIARDRGFVSREAMARGLA